MNRRAIGQIARIIAQSTDLEDGFFVLFGGDLPPGIALALKLALPIAYSHEQFATESEDALVRAEPVSAAIGGSAGKNRD